MNQSLDTAPPKFEIKKLNNPENQDKNSKDKPVVDNEGNEQQSSIKLQLFKFAPFAKAE